VRALGSQSNSLEIVKTDGSKPERIGNHTITGKLGVSPDGQWVLATVVGSSGRLMAVPVHGGGAAVPICADDCAAAWSTDGKSFRVRPGVHANDDATISTAPQVRTLLIPVPGGRGLPVLPASGIPSDPAWQGPPGTQLIDRNMLSALDARTYAFVRSDLQRNLFRIPIH